MRKTKNLTEGQLHTNALIVAAVAGMLEGHPSAMLTGDGLKGLAHEVNTLVGDDAPADSTPVTKELMRKASRTALYKLGYQRLDVEIFIKVQR